MNLAKSPVSRNAVKVRTVRPIAKVGVVGAKSGTAANESLRRVGGDFVVPEAANGRDASRIGIDPVLLIHNERAETFRLLAQWIRQGFRALMGQSPARATA